MLRFSRACAILLLSLTSLTVIADDLDDAKASVATIKKLIGQGDFENLYDRYVSALFKSQAPRATFIQNMKQGRQTVGAIRESTLISHTFSEKDLTTGYTGKIYSFDYLSKYNQAAFYERLVVIKENDGQFRLAGIWAQPAPR